MYDSTEDTQKHIDRVQQFISAFCGEMTKRAAVHDASKLLPPEKAAFDEATPRLKDLKYDSPEYRESLATLGEALTHHYFVNSHHPEYYAFDVTGEIMKDMLENGTAVGYMTLFDIVEMFCDWIAGSERSPNGNMGVSISKNTERFGLSWQLERIFRNTAVAMRSVLREQNVEESSVL